MPTVRSNSNFFAKALAQPTPMRVLRRLGRQDGCIGCDIAADLELAQSTVQVGPAPDPARIAGSQSLQPRCGRPGDTWRRRAITRSIVRRPPQGRPHLAQIATSSCTSTRRSAASGERRGRKVIACSGQTAAQRPHGPQALSWNVRT
jgi:hypothetical protein